MTTADHSRQNGQRTHERRPINAASLSLVFIAAVLIAALLIGLSQERVSPLLLLLPLGIGTWGIMTLRS